MRHRVTAGQPAKVSVGNRDAACSKSNRRCIGVFAWSDPRLAAVTQQWAATTPHPAFDRRKRRTPSRRCRVPRKTRLFRLMTGTARCAKAADWMHRMFKVSHERVRPDRVGMRLYSWRRRAVTFFSQVSGTVDGCISASWQRTPRAGRSLRRPPLFVIVLPSIAPRGPKWQRRPASSTAGRHRGSDAEYLHGFFERFC